MRIRSTIYAIVLGIAGLAGCGASEAGDPREGVDAIATDGTHGTDTTAADQAGSDATDPAELDLVAADDASDDFTSCTYRGRVLDEAGAAVEKAAIVICGEEALFCVKGTSKADGTWTVIGAKRLTMGIKILGSLSGHTSVTLPQGPCTQPDTDLGDVVLYTPADGEVVTAATGGPAWAHPDLHLDLPADLDFPNYEVATPVRAAAVDMSKLHPSLAAQITPLAAFAIVPYDTETPLPVAFEAHLPVSSTTVGVYVLDYLTGLFLPLADAPVDADGMARVTATGGLPQLTWVAFVAR